VTPQPLLSTARTLVELHVQNNDRSAGLWDLYAEHRERLTALVLSAAAEGGRVLVLGAGNVNDLDLRALGDRFDEVHHAELADAS
jgi:methylmalonyl-CoA mutase cobalamin-binding subunit